MDRINIISAAKHHFRNTIKQSTTSELKKILQKGFILQESEALDFGKNDDNIYELKDNKNENNRKANNTY